MCRHLLYSLFSLYHIKGCLHLKPHANGSGIVGCYMLHRFAQPIACCWKRSNFWAINSQHFFCSMIAKVERNDVRSVCTALPTLLGPHMCITHGLLEGHSHVSQYSRSNSFNLSILWCNPLQVPTLFRVVASICTPLPTLSNKPLTFFRQQCWELLRTFAHSLRRATFGTVRHFLKISIGHNYLAESTSR